MKMEYVVCDSCGASIPQATGAVVLPYGGRSEMHLCEECFCNILGKKSEQIVSKIKGDTNLDSTVESIGNMSDGAERIKHE